MLFSACDGRQTIKTMAIPVTRPRARGLKQRFRLWGLTVATILVALAVCVSNRRAPSMYHDQTRKAEAWSFAYQIQSTPVDAISPEGVRIHGGPADPDKAKRIIPIVRDVLNSYPVPDRRYFPIRNVIVVSALSMHSKVVALCCGQDMYLDDELAEFHRRYAMSTIHHELFHILTLHPAFEGWPPCEYDELGWQGAQSPMMPGFVSRYAHANAHEDMAETYAAMIAEWPSLFSRMASDELLRRKVKCIKDIVRERLQLTDDEVFWTKLRSEFDQGQAEDGAPADGR